MSITHQLIDDWIYHDPKPGVHVLFCTKPCTWKKCKMCSLPSKASEDVSYADIITQIEEFCGDRIMRRIEDLEQDEFCIHSMTIGNNGSIMDPETFPPSALFHCISRLWPLLPYMERLSLITEPKYVTDEYLSLLLTEFKSWNADPYHVEKVNEIEFSIGLEAMNEEARAWIGKQFKVSDIEQLAARLETLNKRADEMNTDENIMLPRFSIKNYVLLKPAKKVPAITGEFKQLTDVEAEQDIVACVAFGKKLSEKYGMHVTTHINPVYVAKESPLVELYQDNKYTPPTPAIIARAIIAANVHWTEKNTFCLGLFDEGLAEQDGSFIPECPDKDELWQALLAFNKQSESNATRKVAIDALSKLLLK